MNASSDNLQELLNKSFLTDYEREWLLNYLQLHGDIELKNIMQRQFNLDTNELDVKTSHRLLEKIHERLGIKAIPPKKIVLMWTFRIACAACITGVIITGAFWFKNTSDKQITGNIPEKQLDKNEVSPGSNKAILTLDDGSTIVLNDAQNGIITQQGNSKISKLNGKLAYNILNSNTAEIFYNTITTPRGGQYQVQLPDGSKVWLNAASHIRFPTAFTGKERKVEITGEVYFEIAKNKAMPFVVDVNGSQIRVTGTHFNVMAYADEAALETTLLEGSVKFVNGSSINILVPGQQSKLLKGGQIKVNSEVDTDDIMAWKNGLFHFEGEDIGLIARQLGRWYDVDVVYDKIINDKFYADIPRSTSLIETLKALEFTGKVHFTIERRKIIVSP